MVEWRKVLQRVDDYRWELPVSYKAGMLVPARVYADEALLELLSEEQALEQAANVAMLPGIVWRSLAMPDIHWGYGFPIGGVAAMRVEDGVVSPGGVGFDINCGTRILLTNLRRDEIAGQMKQLVDQLFRDVPAGLGGKGPLTLTEPELDEVMVKGSSWMIEQGYGWPEDLEVTESGGRLSGADPAAVSERARKRGMPQLGTLGSGNHFLEVQALEEVYDRRAADCFGLGEPGQVVVFLHCGSRGFGHQVCQDYLDVMETASQRYGIHLPDKQLACAPVRSEEGTAYLGAMNAAANFAWANRQYITYWVRRSFAKVFGRSAEELGMHLVYDVCHNIAKIERHTFEGSEIEVCVHRKGATRAFPAGHPGDPGSLPRRRPAGADSRRHGPLLVRLRRRRARDARDLGLHLPRRRQDPQPPRSGATAEGRQHRPATGAARHPRARPQPGRARRGSQRGLQGRGSGGQRAGKGGHCAAGGEDAPSGRDQGLERLRCQHRGLRPATTPGGVPDHCAHRYALNPTLG